MKYNKLDKKAKDLHRKYKELQVFLKDKNIPSDKSFELMEYEKKLYNQYLFYNGLKKSIQSKEGD